MLPSSPFTVSRQCTQTTHTTSDGKDFILAKCREQIWTFFSFSSFIYVPAQSHVPRHLIASFVDQTHIQWIFKRKKVTHNRQTNDGKQFNDHAWSSACQYIRWMDNVHTENCVLCSLVISREAVLGDVGKSDRTQWVARWKREYLIHTSHGICAHIFGCMWCVIEVCVHI